MYCKHCSTDRPLEGFYANNRSKCKDCIKAAATKFRNENIERVRAYDRMRASMPHRIASSKRVVAQWIADNPARRAANIKVGNAVRDGRLKKQPCWVCGEKAVAHHPDYDRPLDVVWLCQPHHKQAHALVANELQQKAAA